MSRPLSNKDVVVYFMREGWQLGRSDNGARGPRFWLQRKLCCGGETINVHLGTIGAMRKRGMIEQVEPKPGDRFWLTRYELNI